MVALFLVIGVVVIGKDIAAL